MHQNFSLKKLFQKRKVLITRTSTSFLLFLLISFPFIMLTSPTEIYDLRRLFASHFWPLSMQASIFEASEAVEKIGLSLKTKPNYFYSSQGSQNFKEKTKTKYSSHFSWHFSRHFSWHFSWHFLWHFSSFHAKSFYLKWEKSRSSLKKYEIIIIVFCKDSNLKLSKLYN